MQKIEYDMIEYELKSIPMAGEEQLGQKLETGKYAIIKKALPEANIKQLRRLSRNLMGINSRPVYIANERMLGNNMSERYSNAGIPSVLKTGKPWIQAMIGKKCLILTNKVLLRRTWPISESRARNLGHNASNLTWHQDSNHKHGDKPMVVMMISLHDGAGSRCPGLSILKSPTNYFQGVFGYEGNRVEEFEQAMLDQQGSFKTEIPDLNSGDMLIFNGLTFHRTFSHESMKSHRDALLIRIIKPEDAENFPDNSHMIIKFS